MNDQMPMGYSPNPNPQQYDPTQMAAGGQAPMQPAPMPDPYQQAPVPQQPQQQPQPQGKSGLAIAALVLGIVAVATSFMPIINNASFFIALVGLILGIIGIVQTRKGKKSGSGIAIASVVLNVVACIAVLASQAYYSSAIDSALDSLGASSSSSASSMSSSSSAQQATTSESTPKYEVSIDSATTTTDYSGAPALVVTFTWTNNSDSDTSFATALYAKCFQNGVQCETAVVSGMDSNYLTQLKPGSTTTVQQAYELSDTSDATIEVTELISLKNEILAEQTFSVA